MPSPAHLTLCLLLGACGTAAARKEEAVREHARVARTAETGPDTAVYVVRQAGHALSPASSVMQLRVAAHDAEVTIENVVGQRSTAGAPDSSAGIPGSRIAALENPAPGSLMVPGWDASVTAPVLAGERYLVEIAPRGGAADSVSVSLASDLNPLMSTRIAVGDSTDGAVLFEVVVTSHGVSVGPPIEAVDVVPTCGTTHVIRSAGTGDLYARYEVPETGERGDVHLAARDADARYRSVTLKTATRGGLRITYLGHELAAAARPAECAP